MTVLGVRTIPSTTVEEARRRVLTLYREWLREASKSAEKLYLDIPVSAVRRQIRMEFEKNRNVKDLGLINVLLMKGTMELVETASIWKQKTHVLKYFEDQKRADRHALQRNFLFKFLEK